MITDDKKLSKFADMKPGPYPDGQERPPPKIKHAFFLP